MPDKIIEERDISIVPLTLTVNGGELLCYDPAHAWDGEAFYERLRKDDNIELKTSMVNADAFTKAFEPCLRAGDDVLYIAMSSGISGTCSAGKNAADNLRGMYPGRAVLVVDTLAASLGEGLMVIEAADMRDAGKTAQEIADILLIRRKEMHQHFMVDNLAYLKRGGRISGSVALLGTIINLKPILKADAEGRIVLDKKILGRRKALRTLADIFSAHYFDAQGNHCAGIAHGGCEKDAVDLAEAIRKNHPDVEFTIVCYEPGTGAHVGPDTVALFFWGEEQDEKGALLSSIRTKIASEAASIKSEIASKLHKDQE